jgi:hypothetical protein
MQTPAILPGLCRLFPNHDSLDSFAIEILCMPRDKSLRQMQIFRLLFRAFWHLTCPCHHDSIKGKQVEAKVDV